MGGIAKSAVLLLGALSACTGQAATSGTAGVPRATAVSSGCTRTATVAQTEGPYFKSGSPRTASLIQNGMVGTRLTLSGRVLNVHCAPVAEAVVDFWQADASGVYGNDGYRLRGHQSTGVDGGYRLDTIIPGLYPGRTEHIHVKVSPPGGPTLTTQLYFAGVERNQEDTIFDSRLVLNLKPAAEGKAATFDFIVSGR